MERLDVRNIHEVRKQRNLREAFNGSVAVAAVTAGMFFVWLSFAVAVDGGGLIGESVLNGFLRVLSFVFGVSVAIAGVSSAFIKP